MVVSTEIVDALQNSLEREGILQTIRAQLRSNVIRLISKNADYPKFVHPNVRFGKSEEGHMALLLVRDLLLSLDLKESTLVFNAEAGLENMRADDRMYLCDKLSLNKAFNGSVIEQLIDARIHNPQPPITNIPTQPTQTSHKDFKYELDNSFEESSFAESKLDESLPLAESKVESKPTSPKEETKESNKYPSLNNNNNNNNTNTATPATSFSATSLVKEKKFDILNKYLDDIVDPNEDDDDGYDFSAISKTKKLEEKGSISNNNNRQESTQSSSSINNNLPSLQSRSNNTLAPLADVKVPSRFQMNLRDILGDELTHKDEKSSPIVPTKSPSYDDAGPEMSSDSDSFSQLDQQELVVKNRSPSPKDSFSESGKRTINQITVQSNSSSSSSKNNNSNNQAADSPSPEAKGTVVTASTNRAAVNKLSQNTVIRSSRGWDNVDTRHDEDFGFEEEDDNSDIIDQTNRLPMFGGGNRRTGPHNLNPTNLSRQSSNNNINASRSSLRIEEAEADQDDSFAPDDSPRRDEEEERLMSSYRSNQDDEDDDRRHGKDEDEDDDEHDDDDDEEDEMVINHDDEEAHNSSSSGSKHDQLSDWERNHNNNNSIANPPNNRNNNNNSNNNNNGTVFSKSRSNNFMKSPSPNTSAMDDYGDDFEADEEDVVEEINSEVEEGQMSVGKQSDDSDEDNNGGRWGTKKASSSAANESSSMFRQRSGLLSSVNNSNTDNSRGRFNFASLHDYSDDDSPQKKPSTSSQQRNNNLASMSTTDKKAMEARILAIDQQVADMEENDDEGELQNVKSAYNQQHRSQPQQQIKKSSNNYHHDDSEEEMSVASENLSVGPENSEEESFSMGH